MMQTAFAFRRGDSRLTVSEILYEKRPFTPEMAARIAKLLNTYADSWMRLQGALDLWVIQQGPKLLAGNKPN